MGQGKLYWIHHSEGVAPDIMIFIKGFTLGKEGQPIAAGGGGEPTAAHLFATAVFCMQPCKATNLLWAL